MMGMKTDWIQSVCSFMRHNEIMNWWGPVPVKPMEEVIYQVNWIAVSTTTDTLPLDVQFILRWSIPVKIIKIVISQTVLVKCTVHIVSESKNIYSGILA